MGNFMQARWKSTSTKILVACVVTVSMILCFTIQETGTAGTRKTGRARSNTTAMSFDVNGTITRSYQLKIITPTIGSIPNAFSIDFRTCKPRRDRTVVCVSLYGDEPLADVFWMKVWATMALFSISTDGWWMHLDMDAIAKPEVAHLKLRSNQLTAQRDAKFEVNSGAYFAYAKEGRNVILEEWAAYRERGKLYYDQKYYLQEQDSLNALRGANIKKIRTLQDGYIAYHSYGGDSDTKETLIRTISLWKSSFLPTPDLLLYILWLVTVARVAPGAKLFATGRVHLSTARFSKDELLRMAHMFLICYFCSVAIIRSSVYVLGNTTFMYKDRFLDLGVIDFYDAKRRYFFDERGACTVAMNAAMSCFHITKPIDFTIHWLIVQMVAVDALGRTEIYKSHLLWNVLFLIVAGLLFVPVWETHCRRHVLQAYDCMGELRKQWSTEVYVSRTNGGQTHVSIKPNGELALRQYQWNVKGF